MSDIKQDGGGLRYNEGKARYDLVPPEFMDAIAAHYERGSKKYAPRNWERGMSWCSCFASLMRHGWAWMRGEDIDPETGTHHMVSVAWNAIALYTYSVRKAGEDDRPLKTAENAMTIKPCQTWFSCFSRRIIGVVSTFWYRISL